ncbi:hypothetical protein IW262DRAFT_1482579 [Armillaria fumosa]|nr:hypothetical protein IW262DRAFT_1482579 [Armillaria fumosa]
MLCLSQWAHVPGTCWSCDESDKVDQKCRVDLDVGIGSPASHKILLLLLLTATTTTTLRYQKRICFQSLFEMMMMAVVWAFVPKSTERNTRAMEHRLESGIDALVPHALAIIIHDRDRETAVEHAGTQGKTNRENLSLSAWADEYDTFCLLVAHFEHEQHDDSDCRIMETQQKEYLAPFFDLQDGSDFGVMSASMNSQPSQSIMAGSLSPGQFDVEMLGNLMSLQGLDSPHQISPLSPSHFRRADYPNQRSVTDRQLRHSQFQQLQDFDLQNQIFQQQISLISSQNGHEHPTVYEQGQHCLPTPISSTELHAEKQPLEFVSPMALNHSHIAQGSYDDSMTVLMPSHARVHQADATSREFSSAPAHIAFQCSPSLLSYSGDLELDDDFSRLTSPQWLGAEQNRFTSSKRLTPSSDDEFHFQPLRSKKSPTTRPHNDGPSSLRRMSNYRGSHSTGSTPLLRSAGFKPGDIVNNEFYRGSPGLSPVDWSMPPPVDLPTLQTNLMASTPTDIPSSQIAPITPASIMNLGGLAHSINSQATKGASSNPLGTVSLTFRPNKSSGRSGLSSTPKSCSVLLATSSANDPTPSFQRKTTHKAAEQMRRDSLKTTFDDLRGLLPPILLPSDNKYPLEEPVLPGALPPRVPPKIGSDCPNEGASKLQLLMCGNDFIRKLKARLERRDEEIARLRQEIGKLRNVIIDNGGHGYFEEGVEPVDLELDLDEIEVKSFAIVNVTTVGAENELGEAECR